jgi:ribosomal protein S18 acetylase RimI-like enzyme
MRCGDVTSGAVGLDIVTLDGRFTEQLAALHAQALPGDVLPALGPGFLRRYYATALQADSQVVIGAVRGDQLVGFCQLSFAPLSLWAVLKAKPFALLAILKLAFVDVKMLLHGAAMAASPPQAVRGLPEIAFIAVLPQSQRSGIGKRLAKAANALAAGKGCSAIVTKTSNASARHLYEREFSAQMVGSTRASRRTYWYLCWHTGPSVEAEDHVAT